MHACIGEGNGNPLQCSSLENPRDGGAWWAAVYGAAQSPTRLKRLSNSSSNIIFNGERQKAFPLQSETRFYIVMEILAGASRQEKEIKVIQQEWKN